MRDYGAFLGPTAAEEDAARRKYRQTHMSATRAQRRPGQQPEQPVVQLNSELSLWNAARIGQGTTMTRSYARHALIEYAEQLGDVAPWVRIGKFFLEVLDVYDDLSSQVSDHFVDACPDEAFVSLSEESLQSDHLYVGWRRRAEQFI